MRRHSQFETIRSEGGLLPADLLLRVREADKGLGGLRGEDYGLLPSEPLNEAIVRSWNRLLGAWAGFQEARAKLTGDDPGTTITRERWLLVLLQELGYGRAQTANAVEIDGKSYPVSHAWEHVPVHLLGCKVDLGSRSRGVAGAATQSPHGIMQELLNRSDERLWGIVSNGLRLRLLRDNSSLTRQAFVEFDLEGMLDGEVYPDFALLWLVCHASRVEGDPAHDCWLEKWAQEATRQGTRALDGLRDGVEHAITALGTDFLRPGANPDLKQALRSGELSTQDYYRQILRLVYRLLFLFVAEDRQLLHHPDAGDDSRERYTQWYSTGRLRDLAGKRRGTKHTDLWEVLKLVMHALGDDDGCPALGLPPLGSYLWTNQAIGHLDSSSLANRSLLEAVRALATVRDGNILRTVDYKNLGAEELGSVYESLLELRPVLDADAGTFALGSAAGNERKTTGSYYTPSNLIACLLDTALDPVLEEAAGEGEQAVLDLKVCDPACGSGHFLVASGHRIAKRLAALRTGDDEPSPEATRAALRDVVSRCLYGVDLNPMAVELCKVSLWMEALDPGRPLSFLDAHIKTGNSLLGTTVDLVQSGIPDDAFKPLEGDDKSFAAALRKRNARERRGQLSLDGDVAEIGAAMAAVEAASDDTPSGVHGLERALAELIASHAKAAARSAADAWCAAFLLPKDGAGGISTDDVRAAAAGTLLPDAADAVAATARQHALFNWELEFPQVFARERSGFDVVVGNPPFLSQLKRGTATAKREVALVRARLGDVGGAYSDTAGLFLVLGTQILCDGGSLALVQPQSLVSARDAAAVRDAVLDDCALMALWLAGENVFAEAAVLTCAPTLRRAPAEGVTVRRFRGGTYEELKPLVVTRAELRGGTWSPLMADAIGVPDVQMHAEGTLGDIATATADFRDQYYGLVPFVYDEREEPLRNDDDPRLITTGLIDPLRLLWGERTTKFAKKNFAAPRVGRREVASSGLGAWVESRSFPKVLVATQTKVIEAVVDEDGALLPSVPVLTVTCREDRLWHVAAVLSSPAATAWALRQFAGAALQTDAIKLSAKQVEQIPLPADGEAWDEAAARARDAAHARTSEDYREALRELARETCRAYGVESQELVEWWLDRVPARKEPTWAA